MQREFYYRLTTLVKTYTIQNEKLNGKTTFYNDEKPIATLEYKNNEPFEGTLIDGNTVSLFKNGKITRETIYNNEYDEKSKDQISKEKMYENGNLAKIVNTTFHITEKPQNTYEGIYKNGKPFSGYFETEEDREFKQVDFYENGEKKFQYSNNYLENMDNYRFQQYNIKSIYKDGKIFDGVEYDLKDRQFISRYLKNGVLTSFDWDLFAMHYFNRIHFELKGNSIKINNFDSKKTAIMEIDNPNKDLTVERKTVLSTKSPSNENTENYHERIILYYTENGKVASRTMDMQQKPAEMEEDNGRMDLIHKIFYSITYETKSAQEIFNDLAEHIGKEEWLRKIENNNILTGIRYNSSGKPYEGILITPNKDNTYSLKLYIEGKMEKQIENVDFKNLKKEVKKLD